MEDDQDRSRRDIEAVGGGGVCAGEPSEKKDSHPLRYVGLRLLKPQGVLFADGSDRHHHAVVANLDWAGERLLQWQREKAGTVEHVHDKVKNALGGGHMPASISTPTRRGSKCR